MFLSLSLVVACGDNGGGGDGGEVDASPALDARAAGTTTLFLNFDGATLTKGFPDDPVNNISSLIRPPGHTVPPWRDGVAARDASIATITAGARAILAPYDVNVVTTRPAAGPYEMIMFGGHARDLFGAGPIDVFGSGQCAGGSVVSYVTESVTDDEVAASLAVGVLANTRFIPITTRRGDCLCYLGNDCLPYTGELCTIGGAGTPTFPTGGPSCNDTVPEPPATIDVHAYFLDRFGPARP